MKVRRGDGGKRRWGEESTYAPFLRLSYHSDDFANDEVIFIE